MGNRIYVGNLSFEATAESIRQAFAPSGDVTDVQVVTSHETGRSRGFAFLTMGNAQEAAKAIATMNGVSLDGRVLRVNAAEERPQRPGFSGHGRSGGSGFRRSNW